MKGVLWFSRHDLTDAQEKTLKNFLNDDIHVNKIDKTIESADEIMDAWNGEKVIAAVLPVHLLSELMDIVPEDVAVLVPKNARKRNEAGDYYFEHLGFEVVEECAYKSYLFNENNVTQKENFEKTEDTAPKS